MSEATYTPGPWQVWKGHTEIFANVRDNKEWTIGGDRIAECFSESLPSSLSEEEAVAQCEANARLIAAAPALLEACKRIAASHVLAESSHLMVALRAAISQATGTQEASK